MTVTSGASDAQVRAVRDPDLSDSQADSAIGNAEPGLAAGGLPRSGNVRAHRQDYPGGGYLAADWRHACTAAASVS